MELDFTYKDTKFPQNSNNFPNLNDTDLKDNFREYKSEIRGLTRNKPYHSRLLEYFNSENILGISEMNYKIPKVEDDSLSALPIGEIYQIISAPLNPPENKTFSIFLKNIQKKFNPNKNIKRENKQIREELELRIEICKRIGAEYKSYAEQLDEKYSNLQIYKSQLEKGIQEFNEIKNELKDKNTGLEKLIRNLEIDLSDDKIDLYISKELGSAEAEILRNEYNKKLEEAKIQFTENKNDLRWIDIKIAPYLNLMERMEEQEETWSKFMDSVLKIQTGFETTFYELKFLTIPSMILGDAAELQRKFSTQLSGLSDTMSLIHEDTDHFAHYESKKTNQDIKKLKKKILKRIEYSKTAKKVSGDFT